MKQSNYLNFKNHHIYVGLDIHYKQWTVSIFTENSFHKTFNQDPKPDLLVKYLRRNFPGGIYHSVYEAGFSGFWIHEELKANCVDSIVINPADVPTTNKERDRKTDKVDSLKLSRSLRNGELTGIYIHNKINYEDRSLVRARESIVKDQTRIKNRIKGLMKFFGKVITKEQAKTHWSKQFIIELENINSFNSAAKTSLNIYLDQLKSQRELLCKITREIRKLSKEERFNEYVTYLVSSPGISTLSSMILLTEIGDINRFENIDKFLCYIGLIPSEHSSGENENRRHMTRRGNSFLRKIIVEASWTAVRKDPGLSMTFNNLCRQHKKSRAIITIARKYAGRIMHILIHKEEYKFMAN